MTLKDEHGQTRSLEIPDNQLGRSIRLLYGVDEEVGLRIPLLMVKRMRD